MTSTPPAETASGDELLQLLDELFSRKTTPDELEEAFISLVTSAGKTPRKLSPPNTSIDTGSTSSPSSPTGRRNAYRLLTTGYRLWRALFSWDTLLTGLSYGSSCSSEKHYYCSV
jgi:hypothetical protein